MNNKEYINANTHTYRDKVYKVRYTMCIRLKNYTHVICTYIHVSKQFLGGE